MTTHNEHSEVEEWVAAFRKEFQADRGYGTDPQFVGAAFDINDYTDWLRTALTTHGAKEREEMLIRVLQEIDDAETEHNPARHGTEPHDIFGLVKSYVGGIVFEIYGRYDALTPQTDVTKN